MEADLLLGDSYGETKSFLPPVATFDCASRILADRGDSCEREEKKA